MRSVTIQAKSVEQAISIAIEQLKVKKEDIDFKVLDEGKSGFMGLFGRKDYTVKVYTKFDPVNGTKELVSNYLSCMEISPEIKVIKESDSHILVDLSGNDLSFLIGKHGSTLDSLEHIINLAMNRQSPYHLYITLNIGNYLEHRKETLERLAKNVAQKVKQTKEDYVFEPMKSRERKIIHSTLQDMANIKTTSIGTEPNRKVVVEYME